MNHEYTLALDSASAHGSAALLRGLEVIAEREVPLRADDEERLMPALVACFEEAGVAPRDLARVVCGEGPGSFTGLRVAASIAKGIATAVACPIFAVSSLALTIAGAVSVVPKGRYLSVLDAYRDELFTLGVELAAGGEIHVDAAPQIIPAAEVERAAAERNARIAGPGQEMDAWPRAAGVAAMLPQVLAAGSVDLVTWEPLYGRAPEAQVRWEKAHGRPLQA